MSLLEELLSGPGPQDRYAQLAQLQAMQQPSAAPTPGGSGDPAFMSGGGENPWDIDVSGNLVTRHGETFDQDAFRSLRGVSQQTGIPIWQFIGGSYRSPEASAALHAQRYDSAGNLKPGYLPAAPAGQSMHNYGLAFDQSKTIPQRIQAALEAAGWHNGASFGDPVHWSYGRTG